MPNCYSHHCLNVIKSCFRAGKNHSFCLEEPSRTWFFCTESSNDCREWLELLKWKLQNKSESCCTRTVWDVTQSAPRDGNQACLSGWTLGQDLGPKIGLGQQKSQVISENSADSISCLHVRFFSPDSPVPTLSFIGASATIITAVGMRYWLKDALYCTEFELWMDIRPWCWTLK